jgi:selenide,water dikinase
MRPLPGVAVTLISEAAVVPYSAMVPAHIAGEYTADEITIDLVRLCQAVKVRFVDERVLGIDTARQEIHFAARPPLRYDVLSVGVGSVPACPAQDVAEVYSLPLRPLHKLLDGLDALEKKVKAASSFHLAIVGGGASGCELALALHRRLGHHASLRMTLLQGPERLLPQFPGKAGRLFAEVLASRRIAVRLGVPVTGCAGDSLVLENGERIACEAVLWATNAAAPALLRASALDTDANGFLAVHETLQSVSDARIFGTGDCVGFSGYPELQKNGVHAVREGAVLFDNVAAFLHEKPLRPFRPQGFCLMLLNTGDGRAVFSYGPVTSKSRWARRLKHRIDRAWIQKFTRFPVMEPATESADSPLMRCGGCGSKISSDVLSAVLKRIEVAQDSRVMLGCKAGEDAAVFQTRADLFGRDPARLVEIQTVDYFRAFVDDPFLFGRIAAQHALSDLYAMNARPFSALAIATLPYARGPIQECQLFELLSGAVRTFSELGVTLAGGHTTEGSELAVGFAVTGHGEQDRLFRKSGLEPGDKLILTKPLGSGALLAAWMRGRCKAAWFEELVRSMLLSNKAAAEVFAANGVRACTDITGFGLAGHLLEMLDASAMSATLTTGAVPVFAGFDEVVKDGIVSSLYADNARASCRVQVADGMPQWLFDPQTSGGLLAAVKTAAVDRILQELRQAGYEVAATIGEVDVPGGAFSIRIVGGKT